LKISRYFHNRKKKKKIPRSLDTILVPLLGIQNCSRGNVREIDCHRLETEADRIAKLNKNYQLDRIDKNQEIRCSENENEYNNIWREINKTTGLISMGMITTRMRHRMVKRADKVIRQNLTISEIGNKVRTIESGGTESRPVPPDLTTR
jgi:hypothetical protein